MKFYLNNKDHFKLYVKENASIKEIMIGKASNLKEIAKILASFTTEQLEGSCYFIARSNAKLEPIQFDSEQHIILYQTHSDDQEHILKSA